LPILLGLLIPVAAGIAIVRYNLFGIDLIIHHTLVYATITAILGLLYGAIVLLLEQLFGFLTGLSYQFPIVISTLTIIVLFNPLRLRVQSSIDRRFYRQKYNAEQIIQGFGQSIRDEVDLNALGNKLVTAVTESLQPNQVSLLLRPLDGGKGEKNLLY
jgi:hypothetical protein